MTSVLMKKSLPSLIIEGYILGRGKGPKRTIKKILKNTNERTVKRPSIIKFILKNIDTFILLIKITNERTVTVSLIHNGHC